MRTRRFTTGAATRRGVVGHAAGNAGVLVLLLVPTLERWVSGHVMAAQ